MNSYVANTGTLSLLVSFLTASVLLTSGEGERDYNPKPSSAAESWFNSILCYFGSWVELFHIHQHLAPAFSGHVSAKGLGKGLV